MASYLTLLSYCTSGVLASEEGGEGGLMEEIMNLKVKLHLQRQRGRQQRPPSSGGSSGGTPAPTLHPIQQYLKDNGGDMVCDPATNLAGAGVFDFDCQDMNLLSFLTGPNLGSGFFTAFSADTLINDVWGWIDSRTTPAKEYALVGMWDGTSIVDLTNFRAPVAVAFVPSTTANSNINRGLWRDIKVVGNVAYIVSEYNGHGLQVVDLTKVAGLGGGGGGKGNNKKSTTPSRNTTVPTLTPVTTKSEIGRAHNVVAFPEAAKVIACGFGGDATNPICGKNSNGASLAIYDVSSNPLNPVLQDCFVDSTGTIGYVHDAHCVLYQGPDVAYRNKPICALFAETKIVILALDTKAILSHFTYEGFGYVHQGWFSKDHAQIYADDELDEERGYTSNTRTILVDLPTLSNTTPPTIDFFYNTLDTTAYIHPNIDHNLYIKGNYLYQASYTAGCRIREIVAPLQLQEVAFFDMEQECEQVTGECDPFAGIWTFYPYFDSGITIGGSIFDGLFVLQPTSLSPS
ncbi:hypothetical protein ACA910_016865 [Epithemia clementina (nom. ined.)]